VTIKGRQFDGNNQPCFLRNSVHCNAWLGCYMHDFLVSWLYRVITVQNCSGLYIIFWLSYRCYTWFSSDSLLISMLLSWFFAFEKNFFILNNDLERSIKFDWVWLSSEIKLNGTVRQICRFDCAQFFNKVRLSFSDKLWFLNSSSGDVRILEGVPTRHSPLVSWPAVDPLMAPFLTSSKILRKRD